MRDGPVGEVSDDGASPQSAARYVPADREWLVLVVGGHSGVGKSVVAEQLGLRLGLPWLQVDDLRLALQYSGALKAESQAVLDYFSDAPEVWRRSPEELRDALIAVGEALTPAIEIVVANHVDTAAPIVIEGDAVLPSIFERAMIRERAARGLVRGVFLVEPDERELLANMQVRGRGIDERDLAGLRVEARAKQIFGEWLTEAAVRAGLPVLPPRPWADLPDRILAAAAADSPSGAA